jgi:acetyltransferase
MGPQGVAQPAGRPGRLWSLPGGPSISIRPIRPADAAALQAYVRSLSSDARYSRFFGALNELPPRELEHVVHMDQTSRLALVAEAVGEHESGLIGEARYAATDPATVEFALSVADRFRGQGLGALLLFVLECRARALQARRLVGDVLRTNRAMLRLAKSSGFVAIGSSDDPRVVRIAKDVRLPKTGRPCVDLAIELPRAA